MKQFRFLVISVFLCLLIAGCGQTARSLSVDKAAARDVCAKFLNAWKEGKSPKDLAPAIIGRDSDWESGKVLESFEVLPEERTDGANLMLTVRRTVLNDGQQEQQEVGYVISTSPRVTIFRTDE